MNIVSDPPDAADYAQAFAADSARRRSLLKTEIVRRMQLPLTFHVRWDDRADELIITEDLSAREMRVSLRAFSDWIDALPRYPLDPDPGPPPWLADVLRALSPIRIPLLNVDMGVVADPGAGHGTWLRLLVPDEHEDVVKTLVCREFVRVFGGCDLRSRGQWAEDDRVLLIFEAWPYASPSSTEMEAVARQVAFPPASPAAGGER